MFKIGLGLGIATCKFCAEKLGKEMRDGEKTEE